MVFPPEPPDADPRLFESGIDRYLAWGSVTNGPFTESGEVVAGYLVVRAADLDEAAKLFLGHPIAEDGIGRFVVHEIALTDQDAREAHLR